ncbi:hydroxyisourate hydrolase (plasmid) [Pantoea dispersa]|uniref:hydroxyisourate hydrolase n=1 Tax=Pantoea TaxID=53335 RepID=UPI000736C1F7|nr:MULTISPECIES: hydroxyisourate hydrolase [Pantoea]KTR98447.1 hydroxyisourate hydrolase [Pantoea dispersa]NIE51720.1 hydroxyisourate hydrolase [Pantoea sp. Ap-870]
MKLQHYLLGGALCAFSMSGLAAEMKNPLSVHVLNLQTGVPTAGIEVELDKKQGEEWVKLAQGTTNEQGRIPALYPAGQKAQTGIYRVIFKTGDYYKKNAQPTFFPEIPVMFNLDNADQHYHIPLLLSQYGYSTYRGN